MSRTRVLAVLVLAAVVAVSAYSLPLAEWTTQLAVGMLPGTAMWVYLGSRAARRALDAQLQEPTSL